MEVRQLQTFCALAEELNFTRTAERVHTVQSNVTSQIKALEAELGSPLFDRLAKRVVLTEAGHRFLPFAEKALAAMEQGYRAVKFGTEPAGPLHIGAPESVLTYRLPEVLKVFRKRYPQVEIIFRPDSDNRMVDELESGRVDLAISMSDSINEEQLSSMRMRSEDIYLFCTPDHPLCCARKVFPKDLIDQTLLLTEAGCGYRKKLDLQLAAVNIRPQHITEFSSVCACRDGDRSFAGGRDRLRTEKETVRGDELARCKDEHRNPYRLAQRQVAFTRHAGIPERRESQGAADIVAHAGAGACYLSPRTSAVF
jgi:DNA-binding transcriptional LysR family regulator